MLTVFSCVDVADMLSQSLVYQILPINTHNFLSFVARNSHGRVLMYVMLGWTISQVHVLRVGCVHHMFSRSDEGVTAVRLGGR